MEHADCATLEAHDLRVRQQLILSVFWFALNFEGAALSAIVIPAQVLLFVATGSAGNARQAVFVGWLSAVGSVTALIVQPAVGALADRTSTPTAHRQPYILGGVLLLMAGMVGLGLTRDVTLFVVAYLLAQMGTNGATAAYQCLLPDRVPPWQRGEASGYMGLMTLLGSVGSLAAAGLLLGAATPRGSLGAAAGTIERGAQLFYLLAGAVLAISVLMTLSWLDRIPPLPYRLSSSGPGGVLRPWLEPWRHPNFTWVFLTRGSVILGFTLFLTFIEYYFAGVAHVSHFIEATVILALLALVGALASTFVLGQLSDRRRRAPVVCFATACMALAALAFVAAPQTVPLWPLGLLFGIGYGAYTSVDWALAIDALPSPRSVGRDLGIWSTASTLPAILAPLLGSLVIGAFGAMGQTAVGYRAVFALAVLFFLLGAIFVLEVREL